MEKVSIKKKYNTKIFDDTLESLEEHEICHKLKKYEVVTNGSYRPNIFRKRNIIKGFTKPLTRNNTAKTINYEIIPNLRRNNTNRFDDSISVTTKCSLSERPIKHVTFSTIEIIRVEKYKKYNKGVTIPKKNYAEYLKELKDESFCTIF